MLGNMAFGPLDQQIVNSWDQSTDLCANPLVIVFQPGKDLLIPRLCCLISKQFSIHVTMLPTFPCSPIWVIKVMCGFI